MTKLSVVIITYNEEKYIQSCISSVKELADEIIVVDSRSNDKTVEIAKSNGAIVHEREFKGYASQKNFAMEVAQGDWILSLDADECASPELVSEIEKIINANPAEDGFLIPRKNIYLGKWLKCWSPDYIVRLVRKGKGRWNGMVHEKIQVDGMVGKLKHHIIHIPFESLKDQYVKNTNYAWLMAVQHYKKGRKFSAIDVIIRPFLNFLQHFVVKGCWMEGMRGLIFSLFYLKYTIEKYSFLYELHRRKENGENF